MSDTSDLKILLEEFREKNERDAEFKGQMLEFKATTERRLLEGNTRMAGIEMKIQNTQPCPLHNGIAAALEKRSEIDEKQTTKLEELDKKTALVEYKLSVKDTAKVAGLAAPLAAILVAIIEAIVKFLVR